MITRSDTVGLIGHDKKYRHTAGILHPVTGLFQTVKTSQHHLQSRFSGDASRLQVDNPVEYPGVRIFHDSLERPFSVFPFLPVPIGPEYKLLLQLPGYVSAGIVVGNIVDTEVLGSIDEPETRKPVAQGGVIMLAFGYEIDPSVFTNSDQSVSGER